MIYLNISYILDDIIQLLAYSVYGQGTKDTALQSSAFLDVDVNQWPLNCHLSGGHPIEQVRYLVGTSYASYH